MGEIIVVMTLILILALAVYGTVRRIRYGSSCCGTKEPGEKKVRVKDKNKANYPFTYVLSVDGMHCSNCARRIENALNKTDGRWATADVAGKQVNLLSKHEETESEISEVISREGYTVRSFMAIM